ncbi:P-loop containing nucleoside triphosphate hydrolase protein [Artomyces pyxidatus]|uniref:P-loop containing nucleoside triphosphate hydrolase protein n=1 Tax=Artomyces pyxidatus TaxID=48021 RepID=A0ACB8THN9_9AGAM|nr:P-loop containing nucleoside triphosphate hydrolase protein [Artomyces pyxidatus]
MKLKPDLLAAKQWIFPLNRPKRDYQFNIAKHCLFENTLVALPTGLGKTFIAGVVMLNFYRWFPEGKVVFVAPTKPLVAQQIDACHKTCGIPGRDAAELTGNTPKPDRHKAWQQQRVFYMTPQTLENDLKSETGDARDICLLVIDEAHKGTGDYAYAKVVRYLMAKNPHFRVLALTATPGSTPEAVQAIVDALHISRIEIRDEQSLDIRGYINEKKIEQHIIPMNEGIAKLRDLLAKVMKGLMNKLASTGVLHGNLDPIMFHPFRAQVASKEISSRPDSRQLAWTFPVLRKVGALARAMGYLLEASPKMCHTSLTAEVETSKTTGKGSGFDKDPQFQVLMNELNLQKSHGFAPHPKMEKLKTLVVHHFGQRMGDNDVRTDGENPAMASDADNTRVMVFVSFREAVDEIVEYLNQESPLIRATKFIGQGTDKQGKKGYAQREQLEVIKRFKEGEFNVLVSTSIGEEGLDIGEIDMIVCYEAQKTPIRMLQRVGRTGRKREGYVHVLLAEGREELNWNKAQEAYADVQQSIVRGEQLEFYADVERLLPDSIKPDCVEMMMEIEEYDRLGTEKRRASSPSKGVKKRKRNDEVGRNIPAGASTGFVSVAELILKQGSKKRKKSDLRFDEDAGVDDETDEEIEAGPLALRRTASTSATTSSKAKKGKAKAKAKRASSMVEGGKKKATSTRKKKADADSKRLNEMTFSQLVRKGEEDSDDMEIERGLVVPRPHTHKSLSPSTPSRSHSPSVPRQINPTLPLSSPEVPLALEQSVIDICSDSDSRSTSPSPKHRMPASPDRAMMDVMVDDSSPDSSKPLTAVVTEERSLTSSSTRNACSVQEDDQSFAYLLSGSEDDAMMGSSPPRPSKRSEPPVASDDIEIVYDGTQVDSPVSVTSSPAGPNGTSRSKEDSRAMPPPALLPLRLNRSISSPSAPPESTFPVRQAGRSNKRAHLLHDPGSSPLRTPPPSQKRIHHAREPSPSTPSPPVRRKKLRIEDTAAARNANPWIDVEATHSGDEISGGSSDVERMDGEDEDDKQFITEASMTQVSPSYDQYAAYRQSLLSQAPAGTKVPAFAGPPQRRGATYRLGPTRENTRRVPVSSSPPREGELPDEYMLGSFVVDDEAEISYMPSSEGI